MHSDMIGSGLVGRKVFVEASGDVPRGENMLYSGTDPESSITEYTLVYKDKKKYSGMKERHVAVNRGLSSIAIAHIERVLY